MSFVPFGYEYTNNVIIIKRNNNSEKTMSVLKSLFEQVNMPMFTESYLKRIVIFFDNRNDLVNFAIECMTLSFMKKNQEYAFFSRLLLSIIFREKKVLSCTTSLEKFNQSLYSEIGLSKNSIKKFKHGPQEYDNQPKINKIFSLDFVKSCRDNKIQ